jgi:hypothetical protein
MEGNIQTQCVKVSALRKRYPDEDIDLEKWMSKPNCLYVGRRGRIFIKQEDGSNKIFHYPGSDWANPYKVGNKKGEYTLKESLQLYEKHVMESGLVDRLHELDGKTLGCFCDQKELKGNVQFCHAQVLVKLSRRDIVRVEVEDQIEKKEDFDVVGVFCVAIKKNGERCTYKVKIGNKCGIHGKK